MTKRNLWAVLTISALGLGVAACGDDDDDTPAPVACTPPTTATVTFSEDVHPILVANCATCHGDAATTQKYGSSTVTTSLAAVLAKVDPTNPATSALLVTGNGGNAHPGGDRLTAEESATIQQWILECAQDN